MRGIVFAKFLQFFFKNLKQTLEIKDKKNGLEGDLARKVKEKLWKWLLQRKWFGEKEGREREGKGKTCFLAIFFLRNCG
jgi:hypothetical protein